MHVRRVLFYLTAPSHQGSQRATTTEGAPLCCIDFENTLCNLKVKELTHENVAIKGKMAGLRMEKKRSEVSLQEQLEKKKKECDDLKERNEVSLQEQLERKQKECDDLKEKVSSLQAEVADTVIN